MPNRSAATSGSTPGNRRTFGPPRWLVVIFVVATGLSFYVLGVGSGRAHQPAEAALVPVAREGQPGPCGCRGERCQPPPGTYWETTEPLPFEIVWTAVEDGVRVDVPLPTGPFPPQIEIKVSRGKLLDDWPVSSMRLVSVAGQERTLLRTTVFPDDCGYEYEVLWAKPPQANGGAAYELEIYLRFSPEIEIEVPAAEDVVQWLDSLPDEAWSNVPTDEHGGALK